MNAHTISRAERRAISREKRAYENCARGELLAARVAKWTARCIAAEVAATIEEARESGPWDDDDGAIPDPSPEVNHAASLRREADRLTSVMLETRDSLARYYARR
jgi:hypothetical protein